MSISMYEQVFSDFENGAEIKYNLDDLEDFDFVKLKVFQLEHGKMFDQLIHFFSLNNNSSKTKPCYYHSPRIVSRLMSSMDWPNIPRPLPSMQIICSHSIILPNTGL